MAPHLHLIIHNVVCVLSAIAALGMAIFTYLNGPRKTANICWTLTLCAVAVFIISHVIGVNIDDPALSRWVLMFNLSIFLIGAFNIHATLAIVGRDKGQKALIVVTYCIAAVCTIFFIIYPDSFLLPSVPKMYLPNYYEPGMFNLARMVFLYVYVVPYEIILLLISYRRSQVIMEKNQFRYLIYSYIIGFGLGFIPNFLVYGIPVDPMLGMSFMVIFAIPFVYGAVRYGFLNIQIIAKQAFVYSVAVALMGAFVTFLNYLRDIIQTNVPDFPLWSLYLFSSVIFVTCAVFVWRKIKEGDVMKYEFITTATHKFRTPLTHIRWASEELLQIASNDDQKEKIGYIQIANAKLVELTNLLVNVSQEESTETYHIEKNDLVVSVKEVITNLKYQADAHGVTLEEHLPTVMPAHIDIIRLKFVIQTLIENAIHYTSKGGTIAISIRREGNVVTFSVKDTGIGIGKDEMPLLFSKFYRSPAAKLADTEGMGIGLYICREIIDRHDGKIWAESEGEKRGSTFSFTVIADK